MRNLCATSLVFSCLLAVTVVMFGNVVGSAESITATALPALPIAVSNNAVTSVQHDDGSFALYSFMGTTVPTASLTTPNSFRYDSSTGVWTQIANAPRLAGRAKVGANAISVAGEVYLVGGYTPGINERTEDRLFRYNPKSNDYTQLSSVPTEVDDTVVGVYEDRFIFLVSGWHGPINNNVLNVQTYDTMTDTWEQATALPGPGTGVFGHSGTLIGNRLITTDGTVLSGSFQITDKFYVGEIQPFTGTHPTEVTWTELDPHPGLPTYRAAASQGDGGDGRMLMLGGTDNPYNISGQGYNGQPSFPLDQVLLFDPNSLQWETASIVGNYIPTMDHRGLVRAGDGWATIGGMIEPGVVTDRVTLYLVPEPGGLFLAGICCAWLGCVSWRRPERNLGK